jgi:hypothetical protein
LWPHKSNQSSKPSTLVPYSIGTGRKPFYQIDEYRVAHRDRYAADQDDAQDGPARCATDSPEY